MSQQQQYTFASANKSEKKAQQLIGQDQSPAKQSKNQDITQPTEAQIANKYKEISENKDLKGKDSYNQVSPAMKYNQQQQIKSLQYQNTSLNSSFTTQINDDKLNKAPLSNVRKNQMQDLHLSKIMDLSKQIDYLSKEYLKKEKEEEVELQQERDNLKQMVIEKSQVIDELKYQIMELEKSKIEKQELEKQYQTMKEYCTSLSEKMQKVSDEYDKICIKLKENEREMEIQKVKNLTTEKQFTDFRETQEYLRRQKEALEDEIQTKYLPKSTQLEMQVKYYSAECEKQNQGMAEKANEIQQLLQKQKDIEKYYEQKNLDTKKNYDTLLKSQLELERQKFELKIQSICQQYEEQIQGQSELCEKQKQQSDLLTEQVMRQDQALTEKEKQIIALSSQVGEITNINSEKSSIESQLKLTFTKIAELETQNSTIQREFESKSKNMEVQEQRLEQTQQKLNIYIKENDKNDKLAKELKKENEQLKGQILILEGIQADLQRVEEQDQNQKSKIMEFEEKMNAITSENETLRVKYLELEQQLDFERRKFEQLKQDHITHIQELTEGFNMDKKSTIENEITIINARQEKELSICQEKFKAQEAKINEYEQMYDKLLREKANFQEMHNKIFIENQQLQKEIQKVPLQEEEIKKSRQQFDFISKKLDQTQMESTKLRTQLEESKANCALKEKLVKDNQMRYDIEKRALNDKIVDLGKQLEIVNSISVEYRSEQMKSTTLENQLRMTQEELQMVQTYKAKYEETSKQLQTIQAENEINKRDVQEKIVILRDLENWKNRALTAEARSEEVETDVKGLIIENERLNQVISSMHNEIEQLKINMNNLEKTDNVIGDLETKLKFYVNENDKLNKILMNRSQPYF